MGKSNENGQFQCVNVFKSVNSIEKTHAFTKLLAEIANMHQRENFTIQLKNGGKDNE